MTWVLIAPRPPARRFDSALVAALGESSAPNYLSLRLSGRHQRGIIMRLEDLQSWTETDQPDFPKKHVEVYMLHLGDWDAALGNLGVTFQDVANEIRDALPLPEDLTNRIERCRNPIASMFPGDWRELRETCRAADKLFPGREFEARMLAVAAERSAEF